MYCHPPPGNNNNKEQSCLVKQHFDILKHKMSLWIILIHPIIMIQVLLLEWRIVAKKMQLFVEQHSAIYFIWINYTCSGINMLVSQAPSLLLSLPVLLEVTNTEHLVAICSIRMNLCSISFYGRGQKLPETLSWAFLFLAIQLWDSRNKTYQI